MSKNKHTDFEHYQQLLERVDEKFNAVNEKYPSQFQCRKGCYSCCRSGLTVTTIEAEFIRMTIQSKPEIRHAVLNLKEAKPVEGFCEFLDAFGGCSIYEARPIVCRSHGAPILIPAEDGSDALDADVCPLNFQDFDLKELPQADWLRVDTLNLVLTAVNRDYDSDRTSDRVPLKIDRFSVD